MSMDMDVNIRNRIDELGKKGKREEGKILKLAGVVLSKGISNEIAYSNVNSATYDHLKDNIVVSGVKTNEFGERSVQVSAIKELGFRLKFLEFGTSKMSAQAPMERGSATSRDEVAAVLAAGMRRIMQL
ncbi:HK97-gp10 family putative phage morphogenesis protein [Virgibacillus salexigens]|uniref:Phage protein, HK97 gp10 family n=1 Tax=Virgibacillus massiliensis TaxID=1462526 RepID=A0A024QBC5_9BACI|nr:HK97-gp10 family putative phage morphogenesis protein [Virgibacillus massiliensis]CDQ39552.1 phage protein, HK97 gp10 family [Virgibacillus massiliensis]